jgi:hypothetical protein
MTTSRIRAWDRHTSLVAGFAACLSALSFLYYFRCREILLYGDAVAHINIARRVFDSRTPGLLQLGTVWLPLPHLLMIPFLLSNWMWRTGLGGSLPSMIAYIFGTVGIFRLTRDVLGTQEPSKHAILAGGAAAFMYAANPNLIYLQSTAMTEPLYLALFIWAMVYFVDIIRNSPSSASASIKCGLCLLSACLTRYDGWFLAAAICGWAAFSLVKQDSGLRLKRDFTKLFLLAAAGPSLWLLYNTAIYRNPLEFVNGPYSAKAIEQRTSNPATPPHPGTANPAIAAQYLLQSAELNVANGQWLQHLWLIAAIAGSVLCISRMALLWPFLLLWIPVPFYALSIAYGGVPLFVPVWWPFSHYNVRYGLELLPALAVFTALALHFGAGHTRNTTKIVFLLVVFTLLALSYGSVFRDPICFREAWINSRTRIAVENKLAAYLGGLPQKTTILMYLGDHVGALQQAGIPLRRVINEGNHRVWKQPYDPDGLWERALANPAKYVDYVIAFDGDAVSSVVDKTSLNTVKVIDVAGQARATIYAPSVGTPKLGTGH